MGQQTYEGSLLILCTEPVTSWEEGVGIGRIKPLKVTQVHAETHLEQINI